MGPSCPLVTARFDLSQEQKYCNVGDEVAKSDRRHSKWIRHTGISWVYCAKQLTFFPSSRNKQVVLDSYQATSFSYITSPLLTKLVRLISFCVSINLEYASLKKRKKKTRPLFSHLDLTPGQKRIFIRCFSLIHDWLGDHHDLQIM